MKLVFLHGLPGVGKLTVGREIEALTGYPLFHNHLTVDLATTLFEFGSPAFVELRESVWLAAFEKAAEAGLPGVIFTFAAERTVPDGFAERVVETVQPRGGEVVFVELTCAAEDLRRRVEEPGRREFGKLASATLLDQLLEDGTLFSLEVPADSRHISVDTTRTGPAEVAADIANALRG